MASLEKPGLDEGCVSDCILPVQTYLNTCQPENMETTRILNAVISYTFRARGMVEYGQYECAIDGVWSGGRR